MSGPGHAVASYARGHVGRAGPIALRIALAEMDRKITDSNLIDEAWSAAGVAVAIAESFDEARAIGGRAIIDVTFALHTRLGLSRTAPPTPFIELISLDPYMEWLAPRMKEDSPWRPIVARWIEAINERLTMHRYSAPHHRMRHAFDLIVAPLEKIIEPTHEMIKLAELFVAFQDLIDAETFIARGWNRIDLPDFERIGGFFGLSDSAHPPSMEHIGEMATRLADSLSEIKIEPADEIGAWIVELIAFMTDVLKRRAAEGAWPEWPVAEPGWLDRLYSWLRGG